MAVLVLAEHDLGVLSAATARIVAAAEKLGAVDLLVAGQGVSAVAAEAAKLAGVEKVLVADSA
ncbi:MAG: Electron transfer flavoprotein alpha subunit, partial [Devosia sp.]|nr:Electron transfer flavoprotein alpha subunit [Devosia sp.]